MNLLAIDPGNINSAYVIVDDQMALLDFAKVTNEALYDQLPSIIKNYNVEHAAIEMMGFMGMGVGKTVFDTCVWIGRFIERIGIKYNYVYRKDEKIKICGSMKVNDSKIRKELIRRFAKFDLKNGKGTKDNRDWFYGFKADIWQAYAVAYTWRLMND